MLDLSARKVYGALAEQCVGGDAKADKVENATSGHLAGLDSNGNLTDSGVSPTEDVTVEGNPVTFDSPFEQDAKSVVVSVKPIQDLHGYDYPWPAGGGKNKLPLVLADIKALNTTGMWSGNVYTYAGSIYTIVTDDADNIIEIAISGTPTADSYLRLYDGAFVGGSYILNGTPSGGGNLSYYTAIIADSQYKDYGSGTNAVTVSDTLSIFIQIKTRNVLNLKFYPMLRLATESDATFAPYSNICPISGIDEVEIGVSDGESAPTTTTILLPSTLYGGEENLTDGSGDSTHELKAISASDDIVFAVLHSGCDLFKLNGVSYKAEGNIISNMFKGDIDFAGAYSAYINSTGNVIFAVPTGLYNASQFKSFLVEQGCTICCELATTTTLSFDPTDVELLEGTNVVTTNGEKVAVTYGRSLWQDIDDLKTDTEGKLDKSDVADVEGDTASKAYSVNDFMLRADGLYKVTAPIASGASITSSNTTKTTIGAVLTALLNA